MAIENAYEKISLEEELREAESVSVDFDELEKSLQDEIDRELLDVDLLVKDREIVENPNVLGESIKAVIWDQFLNQMGVNAGDTFIAENNGQRLDLSKDAHIQTSDNFANGKIATHNTHIDYQQRYNDWQANFEKDADGNIMMHTTRTGKVVENLVSGARDRFDENRPSGSAARGTNMDHTVPAAEIIRDPRANAHLSQSEQVDFANSKENLYEMDASLNKSKSDLATDEWLDNPNANGQKPSEIFDISEEKEKELREVNKKAREEYEKRLKEGEKRSVETGKQSMKEEAVRIGNQTAKAVLFSLLAGLLREIVGGFVSWIVSKDKSLKSLLLSLRDAFLSFVKKFKFHFFNAVEIAVTVVLEAIFGPIVRLFRRIWMLLKQGFRSLRQAIVYLKNPANQEKSSDIKAMEIGKIVIAGLSAVGAIFLTQGIEAGLTYLGQYCPALIYEIPVLGSLASIIAIFLGGLTTGIVGALFMLVIDKTIERTKAEMTEETIIEKRNNALHLQEQLVDVKETKMEMVRDDTAKRIIERHNNAEKRLEDLYSDVKEKNIGKADFSQIDDPLNDIWKRLSKI